MPDRARPETKQPAPGPRGIFFPINAGHSGEPVCLQNAFALIGGIMCTLYIGRRLPFVLSPRSGTTVSSERRHQSLIRTRTRMDVASRHVGRRRAGPLHVSRQCQVRNQNERTHIISNIAAIRDSRMPDLDRCHHCRLRIALVGSSGLGARPLIACRRDAGRSG